MLTVYSTCNTGLLVELSPLATARVAENCSSAIFNNQPLLLAVPLTHAVGHGAGTTM